MKKALAYVKGLDIEDLTEAGLSLISKDMDDFSPKEQFEVLLCVFARFLGTIGAESESESDGANVDAPAVPSGAEPSHALDGDPYQTATVSEVTAETLTDTQLQAALANLPVEAEHTEKDRAVVRAYRARFAHR